MLLLATIIIVLAVAYAQYANGLFSSVAMLFSVIVAGLVAFNFWEPIADLLDPILARGALAGCEDFLVLTGFFSIALLLMRMATNYIAPEMIEEHGYFQFFGASAVGALTGYLVAGFLTCAMQTLPLDEHFLDYEPRSSTEAAYRPFMPADRIWLSLMRHAGAAPLRHGEGDEKATFDRDGTFDLRYRRYRRGYEGRPPSPYQGEFDMELGKIR